LIQANFFADRFRKGIVVAGNRFGTGFTGARVGQDDRLGGDVEKLLVIRR
jgi:hypothetical protein